MNVKVLAGVTAAGLLILSGVWLRAHERQVLGDAETRVAAAHDSLVVAQKEVERAHTIIGEVVLIAKKDSARADSAVHVANAAARETERLKTKVRTDAKPEDRAAVDSLIAADSATIASLRVAVTADSARADTLQDGLNVALAALAKLSVAASHEDTAARAVAKAATPSFWAKITPKPGFGIAAGVTPQGTVTVVAGVTLGWGF